MAFVPTDQAKLINNLIEVFVAIDYGACHGLSELQLEQQHHVSGAMLHRMAARAEINVQELASTPEDRWKATLLVPLVKKHTSATDQTPLGLHFIEEDTVQKSIGCA